VFRLPIQVLEQCFTHDLFKLTGFHPRRVEGKEFNAFQPRAFQLGDVTSPKESVGAKCIEDDFEQGLNAWVRVGVVGI